MLEKLPRKLGEALSGLKAGVGKTAYHAAFADVPEGLRLSSPAFADGAPMPARHTADGAGVSPPLAWSEVPAGTASLAILVEDAGSPTPEPLVHLIAWDIDPGDIDPGGGALAEGALPSPGHPGAGSLGRNSFLKAEWLPPDPPPGHGPHAYLFQVYALGQALAFAEIPGRGAFVAALRGRVLGKGCLIGTYERA